MEDLMRRLIGALRDTDSTGQHKELLAEAERWLRDQQERPRREPPCESPIPPDRRLPPYADLY